MHLAVFGGTGRLGRLVIRQALSRGMTLTAHSRRPNSGAGSVAMWVTGDTGNAVRNADTVLVLFGPRNSSGEPFCSAETGRIIEGMQRYGVRRILCVTGAMIGAYPENRTRFFQLLTDWVQRHYPVMMDDRAQQERLVQESGLDWTIFKPPRLSGADASGRIVLGSSVTVGMLSKVSRADLAAAMLDEVVQGRFVGQCAFVRNV